MNDDGWRSDLEIRLLTTIIAAGSLLDRANATLRSSGLFQSSYALRSRVKSKARLRDKIISKRVEGRPKYDLDDVGDVIGIRLISLYRQDMTSVVENVLELLYRSTINPNAFRGAKLLEIKSYTSNSITELDPVNIELKQMYEREYENKSGGVKFEQIARSRYSSVHMVIQVPCEHEGDQHVISMELQFRSVFEDAWAEIDHKLLYEMGRYNEPVDEQHREAVAQHMGVLKKMMDTAADYADVIRRTVTPSEPSVSIPRNLDGADYIDKLSANGQIPPALRDAIVPILREKAQLDREIEDANSSRTTLDYVDIANKLLAIEPAIYAATQTQKSQALDVLLFSCRMEEALCRLLSGDAGQLQRALLVYNDVTEKFPSFPAGWFRLAQAQQRFADTSDPTSDSGRDAARGAYEALARAREKLALVDAMAPAGRLFLISPVQETYIRVNAARLQGFALWRLSDRRRRAQQQAFPEDIEDVLTAYRVTAEALDQETDDTQRRKLANNAAFFGADVLELAGQLNVKRSDLPGRDEMSSLIKIVEQEPTEELRRSIIRLDTIVRAKKAIGDDEGARHFAEQILDINTADESVVTPKRAMSAYALEARTRAVQNAWKIVRPGRSVN